MYKQLQKLSDETFMARPVTVLVSENIIHGFLTQIQCDVTALVSLL